MATDGPTPNHEGPGAPASEADAGRPLPLAARLRATATAAPDHDALRWQDQRMTYGELDARVDAAAAGLAGLGVGGGDRVAIVLPNTPTFAEAWFAVLRLGAVAVPAAPALAPDELRHVLRDAGAVVAVVGATVEQTIAGVRDDLPALDHLVVDAATADAADLTWAAVVAGEPGDGGVPADDAPQPDDLAALVYTSGTTGRPRGAMLTVRNLAVNQDQALAGRHRLEPDDVVLLVLPLFHVYGLNVGLGPSVAVGSTIVLQERFDASPTAELIARDRVTVVLGAPPMYVAWAQQPPGDLLATVRLCTSGAAPLRRTTAAAFREATGLEIIEGYGLTEAGPSVTSTAMGEDPPAGTVGRALPDVELRLVDDGRDVQGTDPGEVWVRGPNVFTGYWHDDEATARALTEDGWLRTGDVGMLDGGGWLHLVDRLTDLIIVSGFNVYPREVERVLLTHPAVADAAVVGTDHPVTGETVVAHVVRADGASIVEAELDAHCRGRLARYKCPTSVRVVTELPRTVTGKVRRTHLRTD